MANSRSAQPRNSDLLTELKAKASAQMAQWPQYKFDDAILCTVKREIDSGFGHAFDAGEVTICKPHEEAADEWSGPLRTVWSFKTKGWQALDTGDVHPGALKRRNPEHDVKREIPLPSIDQCVRAGTHMKRCTGDGYCKVCFDKSDFDDFNLVTFDPTTRTVSPVRKRGAAQRRRP